MKKQLAIAGGRWMPSLGGICSFALVGLLSASLTGCLVEVEDERPLGDEAVETAADDNGLATSAEGLYAAPEAIAPEDPTNGRLGDDKSDPRPDPWDPGATGMIPPHHAPGGGGPYDPDPTCDPDWDGEQPDHAQ